MNSFKFTSNLPEFEEQFLRGLQANVLAATMILHGEVIRGLSGSRGGRTYKIPGSKGTYQASLPGQAPAVRLGDLRRKYTYKTSNMGLVGEVGNPLPYAVMLEKGTRRIAPRPHLYPAFERARGGIMQALGKDVI